MLSDAQLTSNLCFPVREMPYADLLTELFFNPLDENRDFPLHGPNLVRFVDALFNKRVDEPGLFRDESFYACRSVFDFYYGRINVALGIQTEDSPVFDETKRDRSRRLLRIAAIFHDLGKIIRKANHPPLGANLIRSYSKTEIDKFLRFLTFEPTDKLEVCNRRFSQISSIIQHHDKFGVVSTGEGGLPLFSDILFFTNDKMEGIKESITLLMLLNLSDIASVCVADEATKLEALVAARKVWALRNEPKNQANDAKEEALLDDIISYCKRPNVNLGLDEAKLSAVLEDWDLLVKCVDDSGGDRIRLKQKLLEIEKNPSRTIVRIVRLLNECAKTSGCVGLMDHGHISPTLVETILAGALGGHGLQYFAELLATVAKFDYGLSFFKGIMCTCVRKYLYSDRATQSDHGIKQKKFSTDWYSLCDKEAWQRLRVKDREEIIKNRGIQLNESELEELRTENLVWEKLGESTRKELCVYKDGWNKLNTDERASFSKVMEDNNIPSEMADLAERITTLFIKVLEGMLNRYTGVIGYSNSNNNPRRFGFELRSLTSDRKVRNKILEFLCVEDTKDPIALTWLTDEITLWSMD